MTPLIFTRRALASSASLFFPGPPAPGAGCMLCLWGSGRNEWQPVSVPGGGPCHMMQYTPMSVPWMISGGDSLMPRLGPHPGHLSLAVSRPDDPSMIQYLSLGGDNIHKWTSLLSAAPDLSPALAADVANFRRLPDQILNINFTDQQLVYDWIYDFQQNKYTKRYHMLGLWGYSCATSCREALMAGDTGPFRRALPMNALLTPQLVFDEAQRFQMTAGVAQDATFLEKQLQDAIAFQDQRAATVKQGLIDIIAKLKNSLSISDPIILQQIYTEVEHQYKKDIFILFLGVHPEFQLLPPHRPIRFSEAIAVIQALEAILIKETHLAVVHRQNYIDQIRILTYNQNQASWAPSP